MLRQVKLIDDFITGVSGVCLSILLAINFVGTK